ncbi:Undecaprenyl diphosphate synthase [Clostridiaceae bacterium JG1575]|nr:Undecaprenyl diphosphate synthase [Clostridiaceae bacterium JG1575]
MSVEQPKVCPNQAPDPSPERMPSHIGIIMDGNGRWAKERGMPRSAGHQAGVETIRTIIKECNRLGIRYVTFYAFSTENWKRSEQEVGFLMDLLVLYLRNEFQELSDNGVVIDHIGDIEGLPPVCQKELLDAYERTKNNTGVHMYLALNYGGQREIVDAARRIAWEAKNGRLNPEELDEKKFSTYLYAGDIPSPELIIRPSGELRLSNFLLYQAAYSEFWFSSIAWPDFTAQDLRRAIVDYQARDRRFGGVKS